MRFDETWKIRFIYYPVITQEIPDVNSGIFHKVNAVYYSVTGIYTISQTNDAESDASISSGSTHAIARFGAAPRAAHSIFVRETGF